MDPVRVSDTINGDHKYFNDFMIYFLRGAHMRIDPYDYELRCQDYFDDRLDEWGEEEAVAAAKAVEWLAPVFCQAGEGYVDVDDGSF